jgi:hypothetical protein
MRPKVAYLACPSTLANSTNRRLDAYQHDLQVGHLGNGLFHIGRYLEAVSWDDPNCDWSEYEAAIIGTTWDYTSRVDEYLSQLALISQETQLLNPLSVIKWNLQKTYLQQLAAANCAVIPTIWCDVLSAMNAASCFEQFNCDTIVIKPQVGAGSWRQVKFHRNDEWPLEHQLPTGPAMIQPFQHRVMIDGEFSFFFFGEHFSHAVNKLPIAGDYRVQALYGGQAVPYRPSHDEIESARTILANAPGPSLYSRIDLIRSDDDQLRLIELELIEPYLFPMHAPQMSEIFANRYLELLSAP